MLMTIEMINLERAHVDVYQNRDALGPAFLRASHSTADWTWLSIEVRV